MRASLFVGEIGVIGQVGANGAFYGVLAGEAAIFAANRFTKISFLWYNVVGCLVVIAVGVLVSKYTDRKPLPA